MDTDLSLNETIAKYDDSPVGESLEAVAKKLAKSTLLVAVEEKPVPGENSIKLKVSKDKNGQLWAYMYADQQEFSTAFPQGGFFVEMSFPDAFKMIKKDELFGGIFINRSPEYMYLIPRVLFDEVHELMSE